MCPVSGRSGLPRAYDGRTVGYIALGSWLRVVDTERDVGVSSADVGVFCFRALWFRSRAYEGRTVGYIALGDGLRVVEAERDVLGLPFQPKTKFSARFAIPVPLT